MAFQMLDRNIHLPSVPSDVSHRFAQGDEWLMTDAERSALTALLAETRPGCAIEIGTYKAGSLSVISRFCKKVYTLDTDDTCRTQFGEKYPNVEFIAGLSGDTLPPLLERIQAAEERLGFVLIDADHSAEGVRRDIENVLRYRPIQPLYIIMHDSFNPEVRRGILQANWSSNPYVHMLEADYVVGRFVTSEEGGYREMWCGFALAVLLPEKRMGDVVMHENESLMFLTVLRHSVYRYNKWWNPLFSFPMAARNFKHAIGRMLQHRAPAVYEALRRRRNTV